jgi:subtilisin family serine protease
MRKSSLLWRLAGLTLLFSLLVTSASLAAPAKADPRDKVAPEVLAATADGGTTDFLVVMAEQADVSAAYQLPTKQEKGRYVFNTLSSLAQRTQAGIKAYLDSQGIAYKSYFSINMLWTQGGQDLVLALAARPEVDRIAANPRVRVELPEPAEPAATSPEPIEWNVMRVNADDVWAMGYTGQGMVVMTADTGVQWDHPAIQPNYRGWNGTTADHNYNWWDAVAQVTAPIDPNGHGTHVTGTQAGGDGPGPFTNDIGVAPGAKWIGCRNMEPSGFGTPARYTQCMDFAIAPWDLNQQNPNPDLSPDAINNSWSCPTSEGCTDPNILLTPVNNVRAAGIVFAAAAQNGGPACSTIVDPPGIYDPATTVGSTTNTDALSSFSSRGPVTRDGSNRRKPDIVAPGSGVRSSYPTNTYTLLSGTSMATPHIAGGVALLLSARPSLRGNVDAIETVLFASAFRTLPSVTTCGGTPYNVFPNNMYGYGRLDLLAAVNAPTAVELAQFSGQTQSAQPQMIIALGLVALLAASLLGVALILRKRTT